MEALHLDVRPMSTGWRVEVENCEPLVFLSGAAAEAGAHALATRIASAGSDVRVTIHDRAEQVVGTRRYFGAH